METKSDPCVRRHVLRGGVVPTVGWGVEGWGGIVPTVGWGVEGWVELCMGYK